MRYCQDKQINELVSSLVRSGRAFTRGRHGKLRTPCGRRFISVPCTPSDHRAFWNLRREVRACLGGCA
jgi:hypothetical protein